MSPDGSNERTVVRMPRGYFIHTFSWSPDGRKIVFTASSGTGSHADLYVVNADGSGRRRLTRTFEDDVHPVWSPAGDAIAFDRQNDGDNAVWVINPDGSNPRELSSGPDFSDPAWSHDGTKIAYGDRGRRGGWVYVMNADGSGRRRVTHAATGTDAYEWRPLFGWSPKSDRIAFLGGEGIWLVNPDGRGRRLVIRGSGDDLHWEDVRWSPDGRAIAVTSVEEDSEILVGAVRGGGLRRLTDNRDVPDTQPTWSPDGKSLAFTRGRQFGGWDTDEPADIYVINADGTGELNLTNSPASESSPVWAPR